MERQPLPYLPSDAVISPLEKSVVQYHLEVYKEREGLSEKENGKPMRGIARAKSALNRVMGNILTGKKNASRKTIVENFRYHVACQVLGAVAMPARRHWAQYDNRDNAPEPKYLIMESREAFNRETQRSLEEMLGSTAQPGMKEFYRHLAVDFFDWAIAHPEGLAFGKLEYADSGCIYLSPKKE
jgi:hypothetical protein